MERMLVLKKAIEVAHTDLDIDDDSLPEIEIFWLKQSVMLSKTFFGETKWIGPVKIDQILPHKTEDPIQQRQNSMD